MFLLESVFNSFGPDFNTWKNPSLQLYDYEFLLATQSFFKEEKEKCYSTHLFVSVSAEWYIITIRK